MLVLSRKASQRITSGNKVGVTVLRTDSGTGKVGGEGEAGRLGGIGLAKQSEARGAGKAARAKELDEERNARRLSAADHASEREQLGIAGCKWVSEAAFGCRRACCWCWSVCCCEATRCCRWSRGRCSAGGER